MKFAFGKLKDRLAKETVSVGLDIGTSAIKLVKLKFSQGQAELCGFAEEPTHTDLALLLKSMAQAQNINKVNISVSGPATVIRYVNFPKMNADELRQALKFEAQKQIPFSVEEVNLDGHILKPDLPENKMLVMLAAAKKDLINQRLKILEDAGMSTNAIDLDSVALVNAFNFNNAGDDGLKTKAVCLLNIGAAISNLNILEAGSPRLSRDIHIAGNGLTQKLVDILGLDFKAAEALKINPDKDRVDKVVSAVEAVLANLSGEIRTSFDYYESQSASSVVKIFLSGAGSKFIGLKDMLANLLGIEVEYWDSLKQISIAANLDSQKVKESSARLAVAVGLALRQ